MVASGCEQVAVCVLLRPRAGSARRRPQWRGQGQRAAGPRFLTSGRGEVRAPGATRSCAPASRSRELHRPRGTSETSAACRARPLMRLRPRRRVTQSPLKATRRGERRGNDGTDPDRDRWRWLRWHVLRAAGTPPACGDAEVTVVNPENHMLYTPLLPRDWNDARVFDQLHQPRLARCGPTEAAWLGSVQVLEPGHEGFLPGRSGCGDVSPSGRVQQPNRVRTVPERRPCSTRPGRCRPGAPGQPRKRLRCTARVTRWRTRLIRQRHRGSAPDPDLARPFQDAPAHSGCLLAHHRLVAALTGGADGPAWSSHEESRCKLGRNPLRTQQHRRCGHGGCGLRAAMSTARSFLPPMENALPNGTPEKHAPRQSAAAAR